MEEILSKAYTELSGIRDYLVKVGPARRKARSPAVLSKLEDAAQIYYDFETGVDTIQRDIEKGYFKDADVKHILSLISKIKDVYKAIEDLATFDVDESSSFEVEKMEFDLKTAVSLLPTMTGDENVTKQLISSIEMYESMLKDTEKKTLIDFILKTRLSENAKVRLSSRYASVKELISDMQKHLLSRKSDSALHAQLLRARQDNKTIEEFGKQVETLFSELTISQSNGESDKFTILKPINEKLAIKRFSDGLRNSRLSTIIAARNYDSLKDAIRGAIDEELSTQDPNSSILSFHRGMSSYRGHYNFRGRGMQWNNRRSHGFSNPRNNSNYHGSFQANSRNDANYGHASRGRHTSHNSRYFSAARYKGRKPSINMAQVNIDSNSNPNAISDNSISDGRSTDQFFLA